MTIQYPDYSHCLVNLACSIQKHFGLEISHATLPFMDVLLEKKYTNVVLMLFDGMGSDALIYHLPSSTGGRKYIYTYWYEPDRSMHDKGCYSTDVGDWITAVSSKVEELCGSLRDTLVIVTADHGHCNLHYDMISEHPDIENMMERPIAIECRAACFYIKPEYRSQFPGAFYRSFVFETNDR